MAEATHSLKLLPQWELDLRRGTQDPQIPEDKASEKKIAQAGITTVITYKTFDALIAIKSL